MTKGILSKWCTKKFHSYSWYCLWKNTKEKTPFSRPTFHILAMITIDKILLIHISSKYLYVYILAGSLLSKGQTYPMNIRYSKSHQMIIISWILGLISMQRAIDARWTRGVQKKIWLCNHTTSRQGGKERGLVEICIYFKLQY